MNIIEDFINRTKTIFEKQKSKVNAEKQSEYHRLVVELIRRKYSENDEFAILRQKDENTAEFEEYFGYCEQCKTEAKRSIYG